MRGYVLPTSIVVMFVLFSGCASMCDSSYDCDFHAFGGIRDRIDRKNGRVGSIFDPALAQAAAVSPRTILTPATPATGAMGGDDGGKPGETTSDDTQDDSDLRDRLLDELDKLDDLPTIPESGDGFNGPDDAGSGDDVI